MFSQLFQQFRTTARNRVSACVRNQSQWAPKKRLSRKAMADLRNLHALDPEQHNIDDLSTKFRVSKDAVRRILKSNFEPSRDVARRQENNRYRAMGLRQKAFRKPENGSASPKKE